MSFLDRIRECNGADLSRYLPFAVAATRVGWMDPALADWLVQRSDAFLRDDRGIHLRAGGDDPAARSTAMAAVVDLLEQAGRITGRRGEMYPVATGYGEPPFFWMERAAVPRFGLRSYGVHMNGYVRKDDDIHMWVARRARGKQTYPGMLDNMVAGGLPMGIGIKDNLVKECAEEAGIPPNIARCAVPVGAVTYCYAGSEGVKPDVQFCFDLELPPEFQPVAEDGEVESFELLPITDVATIVRDTQQFKFNCNLVIIDFLMRHGVITPDHPHYVKISRGLHR